MLTKIFKDNKLFEFSNYSKYYDKTNKLIEKMKGDICGISIKCFVRLKVEMYIYITEDDH